MKSILKSFYTILAALCIYTGAQAQTMNLVLTRTGANPARTLQHYTLVGTANGSFATGAARSWTSSVITLRIPKTFNLVTGGFKTLTSGPSADFQNVTSGFSAMSYMDQPTSTPIGTTGANNSSLLYLFNLNEINGTDDGFMYFGITNGASGSLQAISTGATVNVLEFDLPFEWGLGSCPDCMSVITAEPQANLSLQLATSITNASTGAGNIATFGNSIAPLPIKLIAFEAKKTDSRTQLNWQTSMEQGSDYFEVERSLDGKNFNTSIRRMIASGNSTTALDYQTYDNDPANGINYYRLKMVDVSGKFSYSEVRAVNFGAVRAYSLHPNPAKEFINVTGMDAGATIMVLTTAGQVVSETKATASTERINLNMAAGMYYIQIVQDGNIVYNQKFVKD